MQHHDKTTFYYLNRPFGGPKSPQASASPPASNLYSNKCSPNYCYCSSNYPLEMIRIDDSCPSWPVSAPNSHDYFSSGSRGGHSAVKGLFCYSTSTGDFACIDMRTRSKAFDVRRDLRRGCITAMITDPWHTWLAMGTSTGDIELYDFRFMVPVKRFEHHYKSSVVRLCMHPAAPSRLVASYQSNNEVAVWNLEKPNANMGT